MIFFSIHFLKNLFCLKMERVTFDQVDAVVEESFFEKESSSKSS